MHLHTHRQVSLLLGVQGEGVLVPLSQGGKTALQVGHLGLTSMQLHSRGLKHTHAHTHTRKGQATSACCQLLFLAQSPHPKQETTHPLVLMDTLCGIYRTQSRSNPLVLTELCTSKSITLDPCSPSLPRSARSTPCTGRR
jgi:hypothetical protein